MRPARLESLILDAPVRKSVAGGRPSGGQVSVVSASGRALARAARCRAPIEHTTERVIYDLDENRCRQRREPR